MDAMDTTAEWKRLEELYRGMSDDELEDLAGEAYELTDLAKQALQAQISQRRLNVVLADNPAQVVDGELEQGDFDPAELDLAVLTRVWDLAEARHVKRVLNDAGIPAYFGAENIENAEALAAATFEKGIELKVRDRDQQRAMGALAKADPVEAESSEGLQEELEYAARCPRCHSQKIVFQSLQPSSASASAFEARYNWSCDACGLRWQDDGVEEPK